MSSVISSVQAACNWHESPSALESCAQTDRRWSSCSLYLHAILSLVYCNYPTPEHTCVFCLAAQTPTFNSTLRGRVLLDLFSEPDIFGIKWDALNAYNNILYPALPDLYGPTMNVSAPPTFPSPLVA